MFPSDVSSAFLLLSLLSLLERIMVKSSGFEEIVPVVYVHAFEM